MTRRVWSDPRVRAVFWQALALAAVVWFLAGIVSNTADNMASRGIASGFGFLDQTAGFGVSTSLIPFDATSTFGRAFLVGLINTLLVSATGIVLATALGFVIGIARLSPNWLLAKIAATYVEILRNIPLLLQIFFWYFAVLRNLPAPRQSYDLGGLAFINNRGLYLPAPESSTGTGIALALFVAALFAVPIVRLTARGGLQRRLRGACWIVAMVALGWFFATVSWDMPRLAGFNFRGGMAMVPELAALVAALSTYTAAFIAENVRSGIQAVPRGQIEAASALGLSRGRTLRLVVVPQALRVIVPPLTNQYLNLTKNSSLATAIAFPDLVSVFGGTVLNITGQAVEVISLTMAVYLAVSLAIAFAMNLYNRAVALRGG